MQIFIDFDGTIVDSKSAHHDAYIDTLAIFDLDFNSVKDNWFGKTTKEVVEKVVRDQFGGDYDKKTIDEICSNKSSLARNNVLNLPPNKNILEIFNISDLDVVYTIFSNSSKESITKYIEKHLNFVNLGAICSGQELHLSKIISAHFSEMVNKFRVADDVLFIDDSADIIKMCMDFNYPSILYNKDMDLKNEIYSYNYSLRR